MPCEVGKSANTSSPCSQGGDDLGDVGDLRLGVPLVGLGVDRAPFDAGDASVGIEPDLRYGMHFHRELSSEHGDGNEYARAAAQAPASIHSAARSAIISVGELVLPLVMVGMTLASTTRRPCDAVHAQARVDDRHRVARRPHLRGADRVEDRRADVAGELRQVVVALELHARA